MREGIARIEEAYIQDGSYGLTSTLVLSFAEKGTKITSGSHQGFGNYGLGGEFTDYWISGVMRAVGVQYWSELVGKYVFFEREDESTFGRVTSITGVETGVTFTPSRWKEPSDD